MLPNISTPHSRHAWISFTEVHKNNKFRKDVYVRPTATVFESKGITLVEKIRIQFCGMIRSRQVIIYGRRVDHKKCKVCEL